MKNKPVLQKRFSSKVESNELLISLFDRYQDSFDKYQWPWEVQRWYELVYCLFSVVENRFGPETFSARAASVLVELGLLEIPALAKADEKTRLHISIVLERIGFSKEQINLMVRALCDLAKYLEETYHGKIQLLLREFGMEIVNKILGNLPLSDTMGEQEASLVVMHWLQNVLNLPVLVPSLGLQTLTSETGAKDEEVLAIVDERNINVALLDDILNRWVGTYPSGKQVGG
jgi:hypothetical protein